MTDFADSVRGRMALVEERLRDAAVQTSTLHSSPGVRAGVARDGADDDDQIDELSRSVSMHLIRAGGKRVRPMLTVMASHLGDPTRAEVIDAAVVVELTHLASLYHDDVMDSADTRRGAPSAHTVWGNNVAILTGDLLFARASRVVSGLGPEAVRIQADTFERLCLGQLRETVGPQPDEDPIEHYLKVLADKTGSLIATSGRFGAMFGGCRHNVTEMMVEYGEKVGVAFQLADDVIDLSASPDVTGKTPGTDLREHVPTMPVLLARRAAAEGDSESAAVVAMIDGDLSDDDVLADVVARLRDLPATAETSRIAHQWAAEAVEALAGLPEGDVKDALTEFAEAVVARQG